MYVYICTYMYKQYIHFIYLHIYPAIHMYCSLFKKLKIIGGYGDEWAGASNEKQDFAAARVSISVHPTYTHTHTHTHTRAHIHAYTYTRTNTQFRMYHMYDTDMLYIYASVYIHI